MSPRTTRVSKPIEGFKLQTGPSIPVCAASSVGTRRSKASPEGLVFAEGPEMRHHDKCRIGIEA